MRAIDSVSRFRGCANLDPANTLLSEARRSTSRHLVTCAMPSIAP